MSLAWAYFLLVFMPPGLHDLFRGKVPYQYASCCIADLDNNTNYKSVCLLIYGYLNGVH